jgi:hypothetical protein
VVSHELGAHSCGESAEKPMLQQPGSTRSSTWSLYSICGVCDKVAVSRASLKVC